MNSLALEIHNLVYQIVRSLESSDRDTCSCYGVTPLQGLVLMDVAKRQPVGMQQLAKQMKLAVSTMTRVVDKLVDGGLIFRQEDRNDRRLVLCSLTKEGYKVSQDLEACYENFFNKIVDQLSADDMKGFLKGLNVMVGQLKSTESGNCCC